MLGTLYWGIGCRFILTEEINILRFLIGKDQGFIDYQWSSKGRKN
jgi:hypothetical protein